MDALCERRIREVIPVSSNERETNAPGARHEGEGLTIDELKGLKQSAIFYYTNGYQQIPFKEFKNVGDSKITTKTVVPDGTEILQH